MKIQTLGLLVLAFAGTAANAAIIGEQNFNALDSSATQTFDSLADGSALTNAASMNVGGPGLDFQTYWFDTRSLGTGPVLSSSDTSDFVGVNSFSGFNAPSVSANGTPVAAGVEHNFEFNDADGKLALTFEALDISGFNTRELSLDVWVNSTGFESTDAFTISLEDTSQSIDLLTWGESELEGNGGDWVSVDFDLDAAVANHGLDASSISLVVGSDTNASSENIFVDNILFTGNTVDVPAPATFWLVALGLMGLARARRI